MKEAENLNQLRKEIVLTAIGGGGGHLASSFSSLEILYALYERKAMKYESSNPKWEHRDKLILSKGHAALAYYVILADVGFFDKKLLEGYCKPGSFLGGEPSGNDIPGVESPTGSLGHGLSYGVGTALGAKLSNSDSKTFVLIGDGECEEGSIWEAAMTASAQNLNNLIAIIDVNNIQKMDKITEIIGDTMWEQKWLSFGWDVISVDGHDVDRLFNIFSVDRSESKKPLAVLANTIKGKGVSIMENNPVWHYRLPNKKETKVIMSELNITQEEIDYAKSLY